MSVIADTLSALRNCGHATVELVAPIFDLSLSLNQGRSNSMLCCSDFWKLEMMLPEPMRMNND